MISAIPFDICGSLRRKRVEASAIFGLLTASCSQQVKHGIAIAGGITIFSSLKRGREFYTSLIRFMWPLILQNLISSSATLIDTLMVSSLGQNEIGAVSLANTPFFIAMLAIFGIQSGGSVLISQYWGKRDTRTINRVLGISWMSALSLVLIFSSVMFLFPRQVMGLITNNDALIDIAARYCKILAYSQVLNAFVTIYIGARRSCESPRFGSRVMLVSVAANILSNYVLIYGKFGFPAMGVEGAALGTVISRIVEFAVTVLYIFFGDKHKKIMPVLPKYLFKPGLLIARDFIRYSVPVILNELFWSLGVSLYVIVYGHMSASSDIMAAYSISGNVGRIITVAMFAVANGTAVFIGKAIGSGASRGEVKALGKTFATLAVIIGLGSGFIMLATLFGILKPFVFPSLSITDAALGICTVMLLCDAAILAFRSFNTTLIVGVLRGGGDVRFSLLLDTCAIYLFSLPAAAIAAFVFDLNITWVYLLVLSEEPVKFIAGFIRFKSGKWIRNVTRVMN